METLLREADMTSDISSVLVSKQTIGGLGSNNSRTASDFMRSVPLLEGSKTKQPWGTSSELCTFTRL